MSTKTAAHEVTQTEELTMQNTTSGEQIANPAPTLPSDLQARVDTFHQACNKYREEQQTLTDIQRETHRLKSAATALDQEAAEANASWKALAHERHADQAKINSEIKRSMRCRDDAEAMRQTAEVRNRLADEIAVGLAGKRIELMRKATDLNKDYMDLRLQTLCNDARFQGLASELLAVCTASAEVLLRAILGSSPAPVPEDDWKALTNERLARAIRDAAKASGTAHRMRLVQVPQRKHGELAIDSHVQLNLARKVLANDEESTVSDKWIAVGPDGQLAAHDQRQRDTLGNQVNTV